MIPIKSSLIHVQWNYIICLPIHCKIIVMYVPNTLPTWQYISPIHKICKISIQNYFILDLADRHIYKHLNIENLSTYIKENDVIVYTYNLTTVFRICIKFSTQEGQLEISSEKVAKFEKSQNKITFRRQNGKSNCKTRLFRKIFMRVSPIKVIFWQVYFG